MTIKTIVLKTAVMEDKFKIVYIAKNDDGQYVDYTYWSGHSFFKLVYNFFSIMVKKEYLYVKVLWRVR